MIDLKKIREKAGLTQSQLAQEIGLDGPQMISNIERGLTSLPSKYFKVISRATKTPLKTLVRLRLEEMEAKLWDNIEKTA